MTLEQAYRQGVEHHVAGRLQQAEQLYRQILQVQPDQPETLHMLGLIAYSVGQPLVAIELIGRALARSPKISGAWNNLGEAQRVAGQFESAVQSFQRAVADGTTAADSYSNMGLALGALDRCDEAAAAFEQALALRPQSAAYLSNYANLLEQLGRSDDALAMHRRAVGADARYAIGQNNFGAALDKHNELFEAESAYRNAVELSPNFVEAWNNLGSVIRRSARFDEALACFERALSIDPDHAGAGWNAGLVYLTRGDYARGWPLYERRFLVEGLQRHRGFSQPRWDGSLIPTGRTLFLHAEQGFGDMIQAARFIPLVAARKAPGARLIVEVHAELIELFRGIAGIDELIELNRPAPAFDTFLPLFSVPGVLQTTLGTIPCGVPYFKVDGERLARFRALIEPSTRAGATTVGLIWAGKQQPDPLRSVPPELLAALASVPDVQFVSLQVGGERPADALPGALRDRTIDLSAHVNDFADTAAAMNVLDLVVTIDTAAAHLAGSLGRPTWTLVPFSPDWRWMERREDNVWYPTMRLFRQTSRGEWAPVIDRIVAELKVSSSRA